ncbi:uncharacterized protein EKO05_0004164 [Ascochyta rabiei]|uniref:uncharacterized protein n=1 Tax=Didymella rabiei TaxID=5454 RepID=UPI0022000B64|nr:uncharacterized protein EKO05_0004164 [Ascochyta rabiei]UPX13664.1 hypothetical protein EKO05_0004164 [Ascochyta rabiei]
MPTFSLLFLSLSLSLTPSTHTQPNPQHVRTAPQKTRSPARRRASKPQRRLQPHRRQAEARRRQRRRREDLHLGRAEGQGKRGAAQEYAVPGSGRSGEKRRRKRAMKAK